MHLTSHITHSNGYAPYIAYYRSNGVDQLFRKLKPKPKLNPPNAHRSQIKICENVQFPFMPNAFRILKPIQKSSKRVGVFRNTGANAFAKNQMRLAYEDKRDLYCTIDFTIILTKIEYYRIRGVALEWFRSYLMNRKLYVSVKGNDSAMHNLNCGVLQGSIIGPLLFIIYCNELPKALKSTKCILYADDTTIFYSFLKRI